MARQTLDRNSKFKLLVSRLRIPRPHVRGYLETLWDVAHECGNPVVGSPEHVEASAEWDGPPGALFAALRDDCWIEEIQPGGSNIWQIHDYWDHCPDYVKKRRSREMDREARGEEMERRTTADNGGQRRTTAADVRDSAPNGRTPAPAPAPAPQEGGEAPTSGAPPRPRPPKFDPRSVPIPEELNTLDFLRVWELRLKERSEPNASGGKPSESQISAQLAKLVKLAKARGLPAAIACVERATEGRHQGIVFQEDFEERGRNGARASPTAEKPLPPGATPALVQRMKDLDEMMGLTRRST